MGAELDVPFTVLQTARAAWDAAGDELDGAWRRLAKASTSGLSAEVSGAVEGFREPWADELKVTAGQAQGYAEEFVFFRGLVIIADRAQAERLRALLPWAQHDAGVSG
ncbi:hypothetical protein ABFU82_13600 [Nocardioides sp. WV_118_6]|uniref:hypothetical protein n=1 Tax=Nocardioides simplex TaxID=2045 RepID=UPI00215018BF|nr:hypothetical protein [Pimelobacter simplex]UUW89729.1 hypothetical protein M0M43_28980 [Pimelobacter simplex]UUW93558.1 hypothetical protein M0M48_17635 [Pimelobacter simplex]